MTGSDGKQSDLCGNAPDGCPLWDLWGHYHVMLGLYLWYLWSGDTNALDVCKRAAGLLMQTFPGSGKPVSTAGAQPMNQALIHIFAILYQETGEDAYLQMVEAIEEDWKSPGSGDYLNSALEEKEFYKFLNGGNRWESLHDIQAIAELYFITGDDKYRKAFENIWKSIVNHDRHNTGGFSSGEEATGNPYDPRPIETCATVAWIALTVDMLRMTGSSYAADELEISTWNAVLGAQSADGKWWTYDTPMGGVAPLVSDKCKEINFLGERRPTLYKLDFQQFPGSPQLSCCSANGPRGLGALSEWAVMVANDGVALNYYGPSTFTLSLTSSENRITLVQETDYPSHGQINLTVTPETSEEFALRLRIPWWSRNTKVQDQWRALDKYFTGNISRDEASMETR